MTNMIIGQGYVLVTPLQVAVAYGAVATGKLLKPHLLKEVRNASGDVAASVKVETAGELDVPEADLAFMRDALNGVATDNADVSKLLNEQGIDPATVACKTGTAEYTNMADTAWWTIPSTWWPAWSSTAAAVRPWRPRWARRFWRLRLPASPRRIRAPAWA